jgi:hypothetical protein
MKVRFQADADLDGRPAAIEELVLIWSASEAEEWMNRLLWIPL